MGYSMSDYEDNEEEEVVCVDCGEYFSLLATKLNEEMGEINGECSHCGCQADHSIVDWDGAGND